MKKETCICNKCGRKETIIKKEWVLHGDDVLCEKCWAEYLKEENQLREKYKLEKIS